MKLLHDISTCKIWEYGSYIVQQQKSSGKVIVWVATATSKDGDVTSRTPYEYPDMDHAQTAMDTLLELKLPDSLKQHQQ